jgi:HK97 gp10 family phage protein
VAKRTASMDLDGMEELMAKLKQVGTEVHNGLRQEAMRKGAEVAREKVENYPTVPVSAIQKQHGKDHFIAEKIDDDHWGIGVHKDHFYLIFHELGAEGGLYKGTKGWNEDIWYETPDIDAKPFLRPSFEENAGEIQRAMGNVIKRGLGL